MHFSSISREPTTCFKHNVSIQIGAKKTNELVAARRKLTNNFSGPVTNCLTPDGVRGPQVRSFWFPASTWVTNEITRHFIIIKEIMTTFCNCELQTITTL